MSLMYNLLSFSIPITPVRIHVHTWYTFLKFTYFKGTIVLLIFSKCVKNLSLKWSPLTAILKHPCFDCFLSSSLTYFWHKNHYMTCRNSANPVSQFYYILWQHYSRFKACWFDNSVPCESNTSISTIFVPPRQVWLHGVIPSGTQWYRL